jgi:hypothetical protein
MIFSIYLPPFPAFLARFCKPKLTLSISLRFVLSRLPGRQISNKPESLQDRYTNITPLSRLPQKPSSRLPNRIPSFFSTSIINFSFFLPFLGQEHSPPLYSIDRRPYLLL